MKTVYTFGTVDSTVHGEPNVHLWVGGELFQVVECFFDLIFFSNFD